MLGKRLVYVASKITDKTPEKQNHNIKIAMAFAAKIYKLGAIPFCPAGYMESGIGMEYFGILTLRDYMFIDLTILGRCDAIFLCPSSFTSLGAQIERRWAIVELIPVFYNLMELREWLKDPYCQKLTVIDDLYRDGRIESQHL